MSDDRGHERLQAWLAEAVADARRRGLAELEPLLESLGRAVAAVRNADWNDEARDSDRPAPPAAGDTP
jgi:hypothetical protein